MNLKPCLSVSALALSLFACRDEVWKLEPTATGKGTLTVTEVKANMSTIASLGAGSQELGSRSPKNSVSFQLQVSVNEGFLPGTVLGTRSACLAGDHVWATPWVGDAGLHASAPGTKPMSFASQFKPNAFAAGPPTACEVRARVQPGLVGPSAPVFDPVEVARFCWSAAKGLQDGACPADVLPRKIASSALSTVAVAAVWNEPTGKGPALAINAALGVGEGSMPQHLAARAACSDGKGPPQQSQLVVHQVKLDYDAGDTFVIRGEGFQKASKLASPRCTIQLRAGASGKDTWDTLSMHCLENGKVRDGACDGIVPGPVTVRMDAELRVFLDRGGHTEGPLTLGPDPQKEAWAPVMASIAETHDEGVVLALPPTLAAASVVALVDALKGLEQKVAIKPQ